MKNTLTFLLLILPSFIFAQAQEAELLGRWSKNSLAGSSLYNNTYNEVWGISRNGHEYAVIGSTAGTHFIDITDPTNPKEAFFVRGVSNGHIVIHRDYHDFDCYLYTISDEGSFSTLQIIDISQLPEKIEVVYSSGEELRNSHNIFIDASAAKLYCLAAIGGINGYSAMRIYDISDPLELNFLGEYNTFGTLRVGHVHDAFVEDNIAYLHCGTDGFAIVDFSDTDNPITLGTLTEYATAGYNHSGWLSEDKQYYYMADETWGSPIKVLDVSDPTDIKVVTTIDAGASSNLSITHNQIVACDYLYTAYYYDGLQVYNIEDPSDPKRVLYYNTSIETYDDTYEGAWGIYPFLPSGNILLSDMQEGLFIFKAADPNCSSQIENCGELSSNKDVNLFEGTIEIFPQPSVGNFSVNIFTEKDLQEVHFELVNITGLQVANLKTKHLQKGENVFEFDLPNLANGIYFLKIANQEFLSTRKFILQK